MDFLMFNFKLIFLNYQQPTKINSSNLLINSCPFLLNGFNQNQFQPIPTHNIKSKTQNKLCKNHNKKEYLKNSLSSSTLKKMLNLILSIKFSHF